MAEDKLSFLDEPDVTEPPAEAPAQVEQPAAETPIAPNRDDKGRFAAAQHEGTGDTTTPDAPPASGQKAEQPTVPVAAMTAEREKRQDAERRVAEFERQLAEQQRLLLDMQARMMAPQQRQPEPEPVQPPDPVEDPQGYAAFVHAQTEQRVAAILQQQAVDFDNRESLFSRAVATKEFGAEAVEAALTAAQRAGVVGSFKSGPDRYSRLVDWHRQQQVLGEVGSDLGAFRSRIEGDLRQSLEAEIRAKVLAELNVQPAPSAPPPSLAAAPGAGLRSQPVEDDTTAFTNAFARRARA